MFCEKVKKWFVFQTFSEMCGLKRYKKQSILIKFNLFDRVSENVMSNICIGVFLA